MLSQLRSTMARERAFVHDAAHELRTPMAVIAAQAHALSGAGSSEERERAQAHLEQAIERASHLTQQLLELASLDDARQRLPKSVDVAQWARQILAQAAPRALARGIELTLDAPDSLEAQIDVPAFQSILENLLNNAIRYVHDGAQVVITLHSDDERTEYGGDDGVGRAPHCWPRGFTRIVPRMNPWPAPHTCEHSNRYEPASFASMVTRTSPRPRFGMTTLGSPRP